MTGTWTTKEIRAFCREVVVAEYELGEWREEPAYGQIRVSASTMRRPVNTADGPVTALVPCVEYITHEPYSGPLQCLLALVSGAPMAVYACRVYDVISTFGSDYQVKATLERKTTYATRLSFFANLLDVIFEVLREFDEDCYPRRVNFCLDELSSLESVPGLGVRTQQFVYFFKEDTQRTARMVTALMRLPSEQQADPDASDSGALEKISGYIWAVAVMIYGRAGHTGLRSYVDQLCAEIRSYAPSNDKTATDYVATITENVRVVSLLHPELDEESEEEDYARPTPQFSQFITDLIKYVESSPDESRPFVRLCRRDAARPE